MVFGFITMYYYGDYNSDSSFSDGSKWGHVVGGDAYNYIIIGVRGVGWMIVGLIAAIFGGIASILNAIEESTESKVKAIKEQTTKLSKLIEDNTKVQQQNESRTA
jgi:hypothetical protein